ncbi:hypothetical protein V8F20_001671 [Naviculisporaceae sp. PSN 640]
MPSNPTKKYKPLALGSCIRGDITIKGNKTQTDENKNETKPDVEIIEPLRAEHMLYMYHEVMDKSPFHNIYEIQPDRSRVIPYYFCEGLADKALRYIPESSVKQKVKEIVRRNPAFRNMVCRRKFREYPHELFVKDWWGFEPLKGVQSLVGFPFLANGIWDSNSQQPPGPVRVVRGKKKNGGQIIHDVIYHLPSGKFRMAEIKRVIVEPPQQC